ncbi:MAG TPA: DapH/DapD/GlmU-related protein [Sphingobacteriaceae bacterium]
MISELKRRIFQIYTIIWTLYATIKVKEYGKGLKVNFRCLFTKRTVIGNDCHFNGLDIIGGGNVVIGDHFHSGSGIMIITQNHNYYSPERLPYDDKDITRDVIIGRCCWIGSRVIVLPGTILEDGVVVQAGAVVFGKIPKGAVVGGNPYRVIKYRDLEKYELLDQQQLYV